MVLIGPVYPYKGGIAHYTSLLYRAISQEFDTILVSYKMQYPKFLFKNEQNDYSNDMFKVEDTKFWINTANPINIFGVAQKINTINPDVVLLQWWHPYFAPCYFILTKFLKKNIKVLFTCHNVFPHGMVCSAVFIGVCLISNKNRISFLISCTLIVLVSFTTGFSSYHESETHKNDEAYYETYQVVQDYINIA